MKEWIDRKGGVADKYWDARLLIICHLKGFLYKWQIHNSGPVSCQIYVRVFVKQIVQIHSVSFIPCCFQIFWYVSTVCFVIPACLVVFSLQNSVLDMSSTVWSWTQSHRNTLFSFYLISSPKECTEGKRKLRVEPKEGGKQVFLLWDVPICCIKTTGYIIFWLHPCSWPGHTDSHRVF